MGQTDLSGSSSREEHPSIPMGDGGANPTLPHSPKALRVRKIKVETACAWNAVWHSVLPRIAPGNVYRNTLQTCFGVFLDGEMVGVAIWSSPVAQNRFKDGAKMLELRRLALSAKCPRNSASRVLGIMERKIRKEFPNVTRLISYQDTSRHAGTIYKAAGWKNAATTGFTSWSTKKRERNADQTSAAKVRWEFTLKEESK